MITAIDVLRHTLKTVNVEVNVDESVEVTIPSQTMQVRGINSSGFSIGEVTIDNDVQNG